MTADGLRPLTHPPSLRDRVYGMLEELIINGTLAPGDRLLETDLAERLNVSRNPVREALTILAHNGWVDLRPRHGAVVHTPTAKEIHDFFQIRGVLEEEGARLAAIRATDKDVQRLRMLIREGLEAVQAGDEVKTAAANSRFHDYITKSADNRVLDEVLGLMKKRLRWYFAPVAKLRGRASWEEHIQLVDALAAHDADRAGAVMRAHSDATAALYRKLQQVRVDTA